MELFLVIGVLVFLAMAVLAISDSSNNAAATRKRQQPQPDDATAQSPPVREAGAEATTLLTKLDEGLAGTLNSVQCTGIGQWCIEQASRKLSAARLYQSRQNWRGAISEAWSGLLHLQAARAIKSEYVRQRTALSGEPAHADSDAVAPQEDYCDFGNARLTSVNRDWVQVGERIARARAMMECVGERLPAYVGTDYKRAERYFEDSRNAKSVTESQELVCAGAFFAQLVIEAAETYLSDEQKAIAFAQASADTPVAAASNSLSAEARKFIQFGCASFLLAGQMLERDVQSRGAQAASLRRGPTVSTLHLNLARRHIAKAKAKYLEKKFGASRYEAAQGWFHANLSREAIDVYFSESELLKEGRPHTIGDRGGDKMSEYALTGYRYRNKGQVEWRRLALTIVKLEALLNVRYPSFAEKAGVLETAHSFETKADETEKWVDVGTIVDRGLRFIDTAVKRIESREDARSLAR